MDPYYADREKTAFTLGTGLWYCAVMHFLTCNASATLDDEKRTNQTVVEYLYGVFGRYNRNGKDVRQAVGGSKRSVPITSRR